MNFKSYGLADLSALTNIMRKRLDDPMYWAYKDKNTTILINANNEIDKRLDALISPEKAKAKSSLSQDDEKVFLGYFNTITGHKHRFMDDKAKRQLVALYGKQTVTHHDVEKAIKSAFADMTNRETVKHLTPEFITRPAQFSKYLNMKDEPTKSLYQPA